MLPMINVITNEVSEISNAFIISSLSIIKLHTNSAIEAKNSIDGIK